MEQEKRFVIASRPIFSGMKGWSSRNLWRMKDFYLSYRGNEKLTALLAEISWLLVCFGYSKALLALFPKILLFSISYKFPICNSCY